MGSRRQLFNHSGKEIPEFHIALLGQVGVGKSALTVKYITKRFIMEYDPTLEDTYTKLETVDNSDLTVKLMDTYDVEESNPNRYLKWAHGFVVVYSITNRTSFDSARVYLDTITQYQRLTGSELPVTLVGNKVDLERYRTVSRLKGEELATEYECTFHETSAAEDFDSVARVFHHIIRDIACVSDRQRALQPLFISEDKTTGALLGASPAPIRTSFRRTKSPKVAEVKENKRDDKDSKEAKAASLPRRTVPTFKIFKQKNFKIFN